MKKAIYFKFLLNLWKIDLLYFSRLFKEWVLGDLEQVILRHYLNLWKENKLTGERCKMSKEIDKKILKALSDKGLNTESFLEGLASFKPT